MLFKSIFHRRVWISWENIFVVADMIGYVNGSGHFHEQNIELLKKAWVFLNMLNSVTGRNGQVEHLIYVTLSKEILILLIRSG